MQNEIVHGCEFICGQRGQGKTQYIIQKILSTESRYLVYDHMAEFSDYKSATVTHSFEYTIKYLQSHKTGLCRCIYATTDADAEEFSLVCRIPFLYRDLVFICDEIDNFATPLSTPLEFKRLIHYGRHSGSSVIAASRRPANVSRDFTSQAKRITCFRITEPRDVTFLNSIVGNDAEKVKNLEPLHYLAFENGKTFSGKLRTPGART